MYCEFPPHFIYQQMGMPYWFGDTISTAGLQSNTDCKRQICLVARGYKDWIGVCFRPQYSANDFVLIEEFRIFTRNIFDTTVLTHQSAFCTSDGRCIKDQPHM